jgi:hypothetical protein
MKLYWRVKINGKWTWRPALEHTKQCNQRLCVYDGILCEAQEHIRALLQLQEEEDGDGR